MREIRYHMPYNAAKKKKKQPNNNRLGKSSMKPLFSKNKTITKALTGKIYRKNDNNNNYLIWW